MVALLEETSQEQRGGLAEQVRMNLSPGIYTISIEEALNNQLHPLPMAWLWLEGRQQDAIQNSATGVSSASLWHTLTGFQEQLRVRVNRPVVMHALCLEQSGFEIRGGLKVSYISL